MSSLPLLRNWSGAFPLIAALVLTSPASAQKINWGSAANDANSTSDGGNLTQSTFTFQLGTFVNSGAPATEFIPTQENISLWSESWVPLDTAVYNQEPAPNENQGFFADSWVVPDNTYQGYQAYIWVYNNHAGDETSEWVLVTDSEGIDAWKIPTSTGSQADFPDQWRVSTATHTLFGGLNDVDGPGETSGGAPPTFALQTNTFLPVPESGTAILFGLTLGSLILRRGRGT